MSERTPSRIARTAHLSVTCLLWLTVILSVVPLIQLAQSDPDDAAAVAAVAIPGTMALVLAAVTLHIVRRITASVRAGDPFVYENVRRLRWIAVISLSEPLVRLGGALARGRIDHPAQAVNLAVSSSLGPIVFALCLFALAEVFAHGVRLREDTEATI
jgi:hypothetical protein